MPLGPGVPGAPLAMSPRRLHALGHWYNNNSNKKATEEMKQRRRPGEGCEQLNASREICVGQRERRRHWREVLLLRLRADRC